MIINTTILHFTEAFIIMPANFPLFIFLGMNCSRFNKAYDHLILILYYQKAIISRFTNFDILTIW